MFDFILFLTVIHLMEDSRRVKSMAVLHVKGENCEQQSNYIFM